MPGEMISHEPNFPRVYFFFSEHVVESEHGLPLLGRAYASRLLLAVDDGYQVSDCSQNSRD